MLVEKLRQISATRGFEFHIGDEQWQNLIDASDDVDQPFANKKVHILLFSDKESSRFDDYGGEIENQYSAIFLLAVRSRISDPNFEYKYDNHLKPLKDLARTIKDQDFLVCDDITLKTFGIEGWRENHLDTNFDCVEVRMSIEYNG